MPGTGRNNNPSVTSKKVSFYEPSDEKISQSRSDSRTTSSIEICELFPSDSTIKPILRVKQDKSSLPSPGRYGQKQTPRKSELDLDKNATPRTIKRQVRKSQSFKRPTETLTHAFLRTLSHREPSGKTAEFLSKAGLLKKPVKQTPGKSVAEELEDTPRQEVTPPQEVITPRKSQISSEIEVLSVAIKCGLCSKKRTLKPAAGFCKVCCEYMCTECVQHHKSRVTRNHAVLVFYCESCKEMRILNKKGSGFCVKCRHFYCSTCVIKHCAQTSHEVLEGNDMLDVIDVMIRR